MHGAHGVPTDHVIRIVVAVFKNVSDTAIDPPPPMAVKVALVLRKQSEPATGMGVQVFIIHFVQCYCFVFMWMRKLERIKSFLLDEELSFQTNARKVN